MSKESAYYILDDIDGKHDVKDLKRELNSLASVISVSVNTDKNSLAVDFDNSGVGQEQIKRKICQMGYEIKSEKSEEHVM